MIEAVIAILAFAFGVFLSMAITEIRINRINKEAAACRERIFKAWNESNARVLTAWQADGERIFAAWKTAQQNCWSIERLANIAKRTALSDSDAPDIGGYKQ